MDVFLRTNRPQQPSILARLFASHLMVILMMHDIVMYLLLVVAKSKKIGAFLLHSLTIILSVTIHWGCHLRPLRCSGVSVIVS